MQVVDSFVLCIISIFLLSVALEKRQNMSKVQVKGIFVGAKVVRGPDWDWGNQVFKNIFTGVSYIKTELENNLNKYSNIFNSLAFQ